MLGMIISRASFDFQGPGLKVKVADFLEKLCHCSGAYIYGWILIQLHTNVRYDNISIKFDFWGPRFNVKVILAIFRKNFVILLAPTFIDGF